MGGHLRQEDHRLRVLRNQRSRAERALPLLHQGSRTGGVLLGGHRLSFGRGHRHRPPAEERDSAQHTADARARGVHRQADGVRQKRQGRIVGTCTALRKRGKSQDAHRNGLCPQNVARHAHDRPRPIRRPRGQQGQSLRQDACGLLPSFRRAERYAVRILRLGNLQIRCRVERLFRGEAQARGGLRHSAERGAIHTGGDHREVPQGHDCQYERRTNPRAVRLDRDARHGRERPEAVRGDSSSRQPVAAQRPRTARRPRHPYRKRSGEIPCRQ